MAKLLLWFVLCRLLLVFHQTGQPSVACGKNPLSQVMYHDESKLARSTSRRPLSVSPPRRSLCAVLKAKKKVVDEEFEALVKQRHAEIEAEHNAEGRSEL